MVSEFWQRFEVGKLTFESLDDVGDIDVRTRGNSYIMSACVKDGMETLLPAAPWKKVTANPRVAMTREIPNFMLKEVMIWVVCGC